MRLATGATRRWGTRRGGTAALRTGGWGLLAVGGGAGCATTLSDLTPYVDEARMLAVQIEPAEAAPGEEVALHGLYADGTGTLDSADVDWSFCHAARPLAELGPVSESCLDPASADLLPLGVGLEPTALLPDDGCSYFGPSPPPATDGSSTRPTDPDATGGYYQPILGFEDGVATTLAAGRIRCGIANVTQDTYTAWNSSYHNNANPQIAGFTADVDGVVDVPTEGAGTPPIVAAGAAVDLAVSWPECPEVAVCGDGICSSDETQVSCASDCTDPVGCGGAETYVLWSPAEAALSSRRESISATWFATAGTLAEPRVGRSGEELDTSVSNTWTAPDAPGEAVLWVVLRDERGGVGFGGYAFTVE